MAGGAERPAASAGYAAGLEDRDRGGLTDAEAKVEWLSPAGERRAAVIALQDVSWARPLRDGKPGPVPKRMADVVQVGDVVMIEPPVRAAEAAACAAPAKGKAPRLRCHHRPTGRRCDKFLWFRARWCRSTRRPGGYWQWWAAGASSKASSTVPPRPAAAGSSFKPIVYLTALEKGISPSQRFLDAPVVVDTPEGRVAPREFRGQFRRPDAAARRAGTVHEPGHDPGRAAGRHAGRRG